MRIILHNLLHRLVAGGGGDDDYGLSSSSTSVLIQGREHLNRAVNGDKVAIQVLEKSQWSRPSNLHLVDSAKDKEDETVGDQEDDLADGKWRLMLLSAVSGCCCWGLRGCCCRGLRGCCQTDRKWMRWLLCDRIRSSDSPGYNLILRPSRPFFVLNSYLPRVWKGSYSPGCRWFGFRQPGCSWFYLLTAPDVI